MDNELSSKQVSIIADGARLLQEGGLVVFPTETVYGIGADARSDQACRRIFKAKGRPGDNPLIVHIGAVRQLFELSAGDPPLEAIRALEIFGPGPITVVIRHNGSVSPVATTGLPTLAVRIPGHPVARRLLKEAAIPVAAPSANRSGRPSPTTYEMAVAAMEGRVDAIIDGGEADVGVESTILDCTETPQRILRPGGVTYEMLRESGFEVVPPKPPVSRIGNEQLPEGSRPQREGEFLAPGSRYRHYEPEAAVYVLDVDDLRGRGEALLSAAGRAPVGIMGEAAGVGQLLAAAPITPRATRFYGSLVEYARSIYATFYQFDQSGCELIVALLPAPEGLGAAIRDRLLRAGRPLV